MKTESWMKSAAREIRIKIHGLGGDGVNSPDDPENRKWLDSVSAEDAKIIAKWSQTK